MSRHFQNILQFTTLSLLFIFSSCAEDSNEKKIRELEKELNSASSPVEKSELANLLHKEYSLYHLTHENDTSFLLNWANMALEGKELKQAKWIYDKYILIEKKDPLVFAQRGKLNAVLGYFAEAGKDFKKAASLINDESEKKRLLQLSSSYTTADSIINTAEEKIKAGINIEHNILKRAEQLINLKQLAAARYDIEGVLAINSKNSSAYYLMAKLRYESGELEEAKRLLESYSKIVKADDIYLSRANELRYLTEERIELETLEKTLQDIEPAYEDLIEAGAESFRLKEFSKASKYFDRLISLYPDSTLGYLYRGQVNIQTGRLNQAMTDINTALELNPENISAHNLRAYIHLLRKEYDKVEQEVELIRSKGGEPLEILKDFLEAKN